MEWGKGGGVLTFFSIDFMWKSDYESLRFIFYFTSINFSSHYYGVG